MDEFVILLLVVIVGAAILTGIVLPIIALVISTRIDEDLLSVTSA